MFKKGSCVMQSKIKKITAIITCCALLLSLVPFSASASEPINRETTLKNEESVDPSDKEEVDEEKEQSDIYYKLKFKSESELENVEITVYDSDDKVLFDDSTNEKGVCLMEKMAPEEGAYFKVDAGKKHYKLIFPEVITDKTVKYTYKAVAVDQTFPDDETFFVSMKKLTKEELEALKEKEEENNNSTDDSTEQDPDVSTDEEDNADTDNNDTNNNDLSGLDKDSLLELIEQMLADKQNGENDKTDNEENNQSNDEEDNSSENDTDKENNDEKPANPNSDSDVKNEIVIHVVSKTNEQIPIVGATVALLDKDSKNTLDMVTTDDKGDAHFDVGAGTYMVQILEPAKGYCRTNEISEITVDAEGNVSGASTLFATAQGTVVLTVLDSATGGIVQNVGLVVKNEKDEQVYSGTTNEKGTVAIPVSDFGKYTVKVSSVPSDYNLNSKEFSFTVEEGFKISGDMEIKLEPKESASASAYSTTTSPSNTGASDSNPVSGEGVPQTGVNDYTLLLIIAAIALASIAVVAIRKERQMKNMDDEDE